MGSCVVVTPDSRDGSSNFGGTGDNCTLLKIAVQIATAHRR
jgi:hypothetical protein